MADSCFTCEPVKLYAEQAAGYSTELLLLLQPGMITLLGSLGVLWIVIEGIRLAHHKTTVGEIGWAFVVLTFAAAALGAGGAMVQGIYTGTLETMGAISSVAFKAGGGSMGSTGYDGMPALVANGELAITNVMHAAQAISSQGSLTSPLPWLYGLLIIIPYIVLVVLYMVQLIMAMFRIMMVAAFSPFLIMCAAFRPTIGVAISGVRVLLASVMVVFACTVALALIIYGVTSLKIGQDLDRTNSALMAQGMSDSKILIAIVLGWLGIAFLAEATNIANSIAQTVLGNGGAAAATGGIVTSVMMMSKLGRQALRAYGSAFGDIAGGGGAGGSGGPGSGSSRDQVRDLVDKFNNINKLPAQ